MGVVIAGQLANQAVVESKHEILAAEMKCLLGRRCKDKFPLQNLLTQKGTCLARIVSSLASRREFELKSAWFSGRKPESQPQGIAGVANPEKKTARRISPGRQIMSPQMPLGRHPEPEFSWVTFLLHQAYPTEGQAQQQLRWFVTDANGYWFKEYMALTNTAGINR